LQSGEFITNESAVKVIIDKKNESSKSYKEDYYQKWLIIYAGGIGLHDIFMEAQNVSFRQSELSLAKIDAVLPNIDINVSSSYFTHIILWDKFTEKIHLLFPYKRTIFDWRQGKIWVNHLPLKE
jgi:hypothetical protein